MQQNKNCIFFNHFWVCTGLVLSALNAEKWIEYRRTNKYACTEWGMVKQKKSSQLNPIMTWITSDREPLDFHTENSIEQNINRFKWIIIVVCLSMVMYIDFFRRYVIYTHRYIASNVGSNVQKVSVRSVWMQTNETENVSLLQKNSLDWSNNWIELLFLSPCNSMHWKCKTCIDRYGG